MSELKVNSIVDASSGNTVQINGQTPSESNMQGRNRIINGDMRIAQRGTSQTFSSNTSRGFVLDRWYGEGFPLNATISKGTLSFDGTTRDCASLSSITGSYEFFQPIEDMVKEDKGKTFTLSFVANGSGTLQPKYNASTVGSVNIGSAITLTSTPTRYTATFTISSSATGDHLFVGFGGSGGSLNLTLVQLEAGAVATPFERRPFGAELALCQRYFQDGRYIGQSQLGNGSIGIGWPLMVEMRASPTGRYGATTAYNSDLLHRNSAGGTETIAGFTGFSAGAKSINGFRNSSNLWQLFFFYEVSAEL